MKLLRVAVLIGLCLASELAVAQIVTWSSDPEPTFTNESTHDKVTLQDQVTFTTEDAEDLDTKTTITGCNAAVTYHQDSIGGDWLVTQPGVPGFTPISGLTATFLAEPWIWSASGSGDTGAIKSISGLFTFDDGRGDADPPDPRHDTTGLLGAANCLLLIPDKISTTWSGSCEIDPPHHYGSFFKMTAINEEHSDFSFNATTVAEEIFSVTCDVPVEPLITALKAAATSTWTIGSAGNNSFIDKHVAGPVMADLFAAGNSSVSLLQMYRITSGGWPSKNPNHRIGQTSGLFGLLNAAHWVEYTSDRADPAFWRVTKDGVTCGHSI